MSDHPLAKVALLGVGLAAAGLYAAGCIAIAVLAGRARGRISSTLDQPTWQTPMRVLP